MRIEMMVKELKYGFFVGLILMQFVVTAQELPPDICKIENGDVVFTIDLRWTKGQQSQLRVQYDLDSSLVVGLYSGERNFVVDGEKWVAVHLDKYHLKLQKPVQEETSWAFPFLRWLFGDFEEVGPMPGYVTEPVYFGYNDFSSQSVFKVDSNLVRFTLSGFPDAQNVYLAGSFNNWMTNDIPLQKKNNTWETFQELDPGKYYYKFIVDGQWIADPKNRIGENDGVNAENSVLFVTNHTFVLDGYTNAASVYVAADFNGWSPNSAKMLKTKKGWELPVFLSFGKHRYKYVVDGKWIVDPGHMNIEPNEHGTNNSLIYIGSPVKFELKGFDYAQNVYLAGSFNNWNGGNTRMKRTDSGWACEYYLGPGNHEYKFVVDGQWMPDPDNPCFHGSGEFVNSFLVYKPNYTFELIGFEGANEVLVTGSFNGWIHHGYKMKKSDGIWKLPLYLPKGKVSYKFIVDGKWMPDPGNEAFETNEVGTYNSVLWIE